MTGKLLLATVFCAGVMAAQEQPEQTPSVPGQNANAVTPKLDVAKPAPRKCSIPLLTIKPAQTPRMPTFRPRSEWAPKAFFIEPPAPPCEDADRYPVLSEAPSVKKDPNRAR